MDGSSLAEARRSLDSDLAHLVREAAWDVRRAQIIWVAVLLACSGMGAAFGVFLWRSADGDLGTGAYAGALLGVLIGLLVGSYLGEGPQRRWSVIAGAAHRPADQPLPADLARLLGGKGPGGTDGDWRRQVDAIAVDRARDDDSAAKGSSMRGTTVLRVALAASVVVVAIAIAFGPRV